ncbi:TetR/AcrR family transcriptional regulator [Marinobacter sp. F4206]|uniref:TetR/AcrR family transcriptional regulator n=1 Tax=Marinobacter sp. F4206 TaxID=2861777 RepID=UPI001C5F57E3|nr:TetR family transcriptional regulator [Marinobacter sp. F4206]MBW4936333.1 TetR family transcriptional regulator [Marinobacter sp. F4206]
MAQEQAGSGGEWTIRSNLSDGEQSPGYRGRRVARAKSEVRRREILEATLRIAARDGIRGIKHRSVAREASVPLAATTYYFRDINELISDAFLFFAEKASADLQAFYDTINLVLDSHSPEQLSRTSPDRWNIARRLSAIATAYLESQFKEGRERILAEQVFLMEALRDERLAKLARSYRQAWMAGLEQLLKRLDSPLPQRDAALIVNVALGMGYDILLGLPEGEENSLQKAVDRIVDLALGVGV